MKRHKGWGWERGREILRQVYQRQCHPLSCQRQLKMSSPLFIRGYDKTLKRSHYDQTAKQIAASDLQFLFRIYPLFLFRYCPAEISLFNLLLLFTHIIHGEYAHSLKMTERGNCSDSTWQYLRQRNFIKNLSRNFWVEFRRYFLETSLLKEIFVEHERLS